MKGISFQNILIFFTCLSIPGIESCNLGCPPNKVFLNGYSRTWTGYAGTLVLFWNPDSGAAIFTYSQPVDEFVTSYFRGEECGDVDDIETLSFNLTSSTLPYRFDFYLEAYNSGSPADAYFSASSGNSELGLVLYIFTDTATFYLGYDTSFHGEEFFDQITINGISFYNVYHSEEDSSTTSTITDIYFTKPNGIVGFKTKDGNIWSLL